MESKMQKDIKFLKGYAIIMTVLAGVAIFSGFRMAGDKTRFAELDVERLNIIEKDGTLRMVASNTERAPDPIIDGKTYHLRQGGNTAGLIFYNNKGDECGGLAFGGQEKDGVRHASAALLFDQFNQDQTIGISYSENGGARSAGFNVWDRPDTPISSMIEKLQVIQKLPDGPEKTAAMQKLRETSGVAQRVFVGKSRDKSAAVVLSDLQGYPRLRLLVDAQDSARLEFLDEKGAVTYSLPEPAKEKPSKP